ncbi:MAG: hypothetical protein AB7G37_05305 [Solirubrobacteraceae bacterium]
MTAVRLTTRERGPRRPRSLRLPGLAAVLVIVVVAVVLWPSGGSAEDRRGATQAIERLFEAVARGSDASSADLCRSVGPRTRRGFAGLARYLPEPRRACSALRPDLLRAALGPLPGTEGRELEADVDGDVAVVSVDDGPEVSRALRRTDRWLPDPGLGGLGRWRLETSRRCSDALTSARLTPLATDPERYGRAIEVRVRGVDAVLEMLADDGLPAGIGGVAAEPRRALQELRDGLRRAERAIAGGDLGRDAPDASRLPSLLQLLEAFPSLRAVGVICLGGPAIPDASVEAGTDACLAARPEVDSAYKQAGRASDDATAAAAFDRLAMTWATLGERFSTLDVGDAEGLGTVRDVVAASAGTAAESARQIAAAAREGTEAPGAPGELNLAQQSALEGLIALGLRRCGDIGV